MMARVVRRGGSCLLLFLILLGSNGYAQSTTEPQEITVFLKNGKVVRGTTTLSMFEGYLTVEEDAFNQAHIPYTDIEQVVFGPVPDLKKARIKKVKKETPFTIKEKGYYSMIDFGALVQSSAYYDYGSGASLTMVNGYAFSPRLRAGIGVGLESYGYNNVNTVPLYLNLSGLINRRRWSPYYFLNAGASAAWISDGDVDGGTFYDTKGGLMLHPGLGYLYHVGRTALSFAVGYKMQKARVRYGWEDWSTGNRVEVDERRTLRRLSITMGVHF